MATWLVLATLCLRFTDPRLLIFMSWQTSLVHWRTETAISTFSDRLILLFRHIIISKDIWGCLISKILCKIFDKLSASII